MIVIDVVPRRAGRWMRGREAIEVRMNDARMLMVRSTLVNVLEWSKNEAEQQSGTSL